MPDLRMKQYDTEYTVVECLDCSHRFLSPRPMANSIASLYPESYYEGRNSSNPKQVKSYIRRIEYLPKIKNGKILDVGCAGGHWLKFLHEQGWDCYGNDFIKNRHEEPNIKIKYGYLPEVDFQESFFDVITAWGVMEHLTYPSKYFEHIHKLLKNGGEFIFLVPNAHSLWSRWNYSEDIPRHIHFFHKKTIEKYACKFDYKIKSIIKTNRIYSKPASGKGLFRKQLLKMYGYSLKDIASGNVSTFADYVGKLGSLLDNLLIHPGFEEIFGLGGCIIASFVKK